jgi:hypothetical protein
MICNAKQMLAETEGKTCQLLAGLRCETTGSAKMSALKESKKHAGQMRNA